MKTALHRAVTVGLLYAVQSLLLPHTTTQAQDADAFGKQVSDGGIQHSFLVTGSMTAIIGEDSSIVWQTPGRSRDGFVLPSGNILVSDGREGKEYTRDGKVVFQYTLSSINKELGTVVRLPNGNTMIVERGPQPRLLEVTHDGTVVVDVPLQPDSDNAHMQTRMARKLPNDNYIVPHLLAFAVKEYAPDGKVVRIIKTDLEELGGRKAENWPFTAIELASGNLLVNLTHGDKTVEFNKAGEVVWRVDNADVGGRFADLCGGQRLAYGNTIICSYGQRNPEMAKVFEVTRDKQVVWEYVNPKLSGIHEIHVLTTNGEPTAWPPLK
ncbi:MAG: hypothetical protein O3C40_35895 [Planctomycetota bacterium]|nr:hypothetical protein [Planctomycetota bacterium]